MIPSLCEWKATERFQYLGERQQGRSHPVLEGTWGVGNDGTKRATQGWRGWLGWSSLWRLERGAEIGLQRIEFVSNSPPKLESSGLSGLTFESGSLKLRGARPVMMKQWFKNISIVPCWAATTSVLHEILAILPLQKLCFVPESLSKGGLFEPAALPVLLTQPCLAQGSGLGFNTEVSALASLVSQECTLYWRDSGVKVKFTWALNEIFTPCFQDLEMRQQISLEQQNFGDTFLFHKVLLRNYSSLGFILCNL